MNFGNAGVPSETPAGREIENTVLRKKCLSYLVDPRLFGLPPTTVKDYDQYAALVRFMEQAFEWNIIDYNFYPFYWANKNRWDELYMRNVDDPLFRAFIQSGVARVIVSVKPGFEDAVMHYMSTGQVWNGGMVPVLGDELYMSIIDELQNPKSIVEETWETRVPSTLTIIQKDGVYLDMEGLPCNCAPEDDAVDIKHTVDQIELLATS